MSDYLENLFKKMEAGYMPSWLDVLSALSATSTYIDQQKGFDVSDIEPTLCELNGHCACND